MLKNPLALRIDDIGASTKRYEIYSNKRWRVGPLRVSGNWLFLKYLPNFRQWGPYREMNASEWFEIFNLLERENAKLTVAITAMWVVSENEQVEFPREFPAEAAALREGLQQGLLEIANHGLTHCLVDGNAFRPKKFGGNREAHREFWDWLPTEVHEDHLRRSQKILGEYFQTDILTLVPPGNVFSEATLSAALKYGIRFLSCSQTTPSISEIYMVDPSFIFAFHDRDVVLNGVDWVRTVLQENKDREKVLVRELAAHLLRVSGEGQ